MAGPTVRVPETPDDNVLTALRDAGAEDPQATWAAILEAVPASTDDITWPLDVPLARMVEKVGMPFDRLTLREPLTTDLIKFGILDGITDAEKMVGLVAELSGKPPPAIKAIPGAEMIRLTARLQRFFALAVG